ncbi:MAG: prolipoprotein diacylglyceryl transferase [Flavobacteriales bacterium]|jgi:phosphatidylglycerol:prolipoprotein diacylglycerol transferase|nr:prolipoprotein diacylglyceryl transferase [Flavobacteriales bacterium]
MYPTLYDSVLDLFGLSIPPFRLVQSFGMMVALAFLAASWDLKSELKRKEGLGLLAPVKKKVWQGKKSSLVEKVISAIIGFAIGYKFLALVLDFDMIAGNPQEFILSAKGNLLGGFLGAALSVGMRFWEDKKESLPEPKEVEITVHPYEQVGTITILAAVFGILGAKLFHNLENWDDLMADPVGALVSFSGLSFLGGLICATIAILWFAKKNNIKLLHLTDAALPGLMLAYGVGRMGCQIAGDGDWGIPNDAPKPEWLSFLPDWAWAYNYPNNVLGIDLKADFAQMGYVSMYGKAWPTPLYETTMALIIFGFLWFMRKRWTTPGMVMSWYLILAGAERMAIEQVRINNEYPIFGGVTQAEIISSVMIVLGIAFLFLMPKVGKKWAQY